MRAAIYVRKSTDQSEVHTSEKSVAHQRAQCLELLAKNEWALAEGHVYEDDGISGAIFGEGRPALLKLMEAVRAKARPFDVIVAYDESRLGRDMIETGYLVKQILDAGVQLFFSDGTQRRLDSSTDALLMSITNFGGQFEREQAAKRTRDKMHAKAREGHATGTVPFGYSSVAVNSHKELRIDPIHSEIVRHIFALSAQGNGITRIAHTLNREHPGLRKWSAPTVRDILSNSVYVGQIVYGKRRVAVKGGKTIKVNVPESEWIRVWKPELQIVSDAQWSAVQARKETMFKTYLRGRNGHLQGRPEQTMSEHLLTGFVVCGVCGGRMTVWSASSKKKLVHRYLVCWKHRSGGNAACANAKSIPLQELTEAIVNHFRDDVLTLERLLQIQRDLVADANSSPEQVAAKRAALEEQERRLAQRLAKLTDAVAEGGAVQTLVAAIKVAEREQREILARLGALDATQKAISQWSDAGEWAKVRALVEDWQGALDGTPTVARQILRKLLVSPIKVTPLAEGGFKYEAEGSYSRLISGIIGGADPGSLTWVHEADVAASRKQDLSQELKALAAAQQPVLALREADGSGGPTS
jgi:site-specific DNA recombinase